MNALLRQAEAIPHRFTVEQMWALQDSGALGDARVELIDGELIDMPADGPRNIDWAGVLGRWLFTAVDDRHLIVPGMTLRLSDEDGPKPDWYVFPAKLAAADVRGPDVLLAIEQSDTTLAKDLGVKAALYARFGLPDYWAIDLERAVVHVHREPGPEGYGSVEVFDRHASVAALLIPGLALRIAGLPRVGG